MTHVPKRLALAASALAVFAVFGAAMYTKPPKAEAVVAGVSSTTPCVGASEPGQWKHVVVLMMENQTYPKVIGNASAPYISDMAKKCGSAYSGTTGAAPKNNWHDSNYKVDGTTDGSYNSKPSYATLTSGLSPTVHGLKDDTFTKTTTVDNIYNQLRLAGKNARNYYSGPASSTPCATSNFTGAYHDTMRYYTNLGGQSSDPTTYCNTHDKALTQFMPDVTSGALPAFSMVFPTNCQNMHSCTSISNVVANGDTWVKGFLAPLLDSDQYKSGDTAIFVIWDEDTAIPNLLIAPSVATGSKVPAPSGNPISHFAALRTWEEMLGLPLIGDTSKAPSLLSFMNGGGTVTQPADTVLPTIGFSSPTGTISVSAGTKVPLTVDATDNVGVTKVAFSVDGVTAAASTVTVAPYNFVWDTAGITAGAHTIRATASDAAGNTATTTITINVTSVSTCPAIPTALGTATMNVNVSAAGTYHVWSLMSAPDTTNNSFYVQVDSSCPVVVGDDPTMAAKAWTWVNFKNGSVNNPYDVTLAAGAHTLTLIGKETGVDVDRVLLLTDICRPTGTGDNCTAVTDTAPPSAKMTAPTSGSVVSGSVTVSATAADDTGGTGVAKVEFYANGAALIGTALTAPYQVPWNTSDLPDGPYKITAKPFDAAGNSSTSLPVDVTIQNLDAIAPSPPASFNIASVSGNSVTLDWSPSTDNPAGTGIGGYHIYRDTLLLGTTPADATSFTDTTAAPNTSYRYAIDAFDRATPANSSGQIFASVTTPTASDGAAPTAPTNVQATSVEPNQVSLIWTASTGPNPIERYVVNRSSLASSVTLGSGPNTGFTDVTVVPGTVYTYTVVAVDSTGNTSPASAGLSVTTSQTGDALAPSTPINVTATGVSPTQVDISWDAATDNVAVAGYEVFRGATSVGKTQSTSFGDATVSSGTNYEYTVVAFDAAGNRSAASTPAVTTVPAVNGAEATTLTFKPTDDAFISGAHTTRNYGTSDHLTINTTSDYEFLTKFKVTGLNGRSVVRARLRLYALNGSSNGGEYHQLTSNKWDEGSVTWKNAPASQKATVAKLGKVTTGKYVYVDLNPVIKADGTYSFRAKTNTSDKAEYSSAEGARSPKLIIDVQ